MTPLSYRAIVERAEIHAAVCRARKAELRCSTCTDTADRAARATAALRLAEVA